MGYAFEPTVDLPGTADGAAASSTSFPSALSFPARIDLWGDEIDSIRLFDPATQRSTELVESIDILPAQETLPGPHASRSRRPPHALHRRAQLQRRDPRAHRRGDTPPPRWRRGRGRQLLCRLLQPRLAARLPTQRCHNRPLSTARHRRGGMGDRGTGARAARGQAVARRASAQLPLVPRPLARDRAHARRVPSPHRRYPLGRGGSRPSRRHRPPLQFRPRIRRRR